MGSMPAVLTRRRVTYLVPRSRRSQTRSPWFLVSLSGGALGLLVYSYVAWEVNVFAVKQGVVL